MDNKNTEEYALLIGLDWADEKHDLCWIETATGKTGHQVLDQTPDSIILWLNELHARYPDQKIAIALELAKGALINALLGYDFLVLYPLNPASVKTYRKTFHPSGAKDDPTDAHLILDLLCKHREKLRPWKPDDETTRKLTLMSEHRRKAVDECTRLTLQMTAHLKGYFPQAPIWLDRLNTRLSCEFLRKWSTLADLKKATPKAIRSFYYARNGRSNPTLETLIQQRTTAQELTHDAPIIETLSRTVRMQAGQILVLLEAIRQFEEIIAILFARHPDAPIFGELPGAGKNLAPRLLCVFGSDRDRHESAEAVQKYVGIAPVTERSGKSTWIHWRWHCPKYLRQAFHEFANCSIRYSEWARSYYFLQLSRGKKHHAAIRALAFKWIRIIFHCWKTKEIYQEEKYLNALKKTGCELWIKIQATHAQT